MWIPLASRVLLISALLPVSAAFAQSNPAPASAYVPTFTYDVASIKENKEVPANGMIRVGGPNPPHAGTINQTNLDALFLVTEAYGFDSAYVTGIPDVFRGKRFNVEGKSDSTTNEKLVKLSNSDAALEKQHMLQVLLADRFKLRIHFETKQADIFAMSVIKSGPKFQLAQPKQPDPVDATDPSKLPTSPLYQRGSSASAFEFHCEGCTMTQFARMMGGQFGKKVIDKTGLTGTYGFVVKYHGRFDDGTAVVDPAAPPLDTALQDQLGLKIEPAKGEVQALVIDHMELPSEN